MGAAREVWASRDGARTRGDLAYLVYVTVLGLLVLGVPTVRVAVTALARPDVLPYLLTAAAPQLVTTAWLAASALLVLFGAMRGPAILSPFFTATLASSAMPRRAALQRPLLRSALTLLLLAVVIALVPGMTLAAAGDASATSAVIFAAAAGGAALLSLGAWLLGELARPAGRRIAAGALLLAALGTALLPVPLGPGAAYPPGVGTVWALVLLLAGLVMVGACIAALNRLRGSVLAEQAGRWASARTVATSGDLAGAAGVFRTLPTAGRRLAAIRVPGVGPLRLPLVYARRDLVGLLRTPESTIVGVLGLLAGAAATALAAGLIGPVSWTLLALGSLAMWLGSGSLVEGIRHGIATLGAPALFGQSAERQVLLHAIAPGVVMLMAAGVGGAAFGAGALMPLLLAPVLLLGRVRDAAKGPMPLQLSMPMPTAQGDASVIGLIAWQSDALLLAVLAAVAVGLGAILAGVPGAVTGMVAGLVIMGSGAATRLKDLRGR